MNLRTSGSMSAAYPPFSLRLRRRLELEPLDRDLTPLRDLSSGRVDLNAAADREQGQFTQPYLPVNPRSTIA